MSLGKILGSISPAFGAISGKGLFGQIAPALAGGGMFGLAGILAQLLGDDEEGQQPPQAQPQQPMQPFGGRQPMGQGPLGRLLGNIF